MAETNKSIVTRLTDAGEDAIQRLSGAPGGDRLVNALNGVRERLDDMQKRMRALTEVEKRLDTVERRIDKLEGKSSPQRNRAGSPGSKPSGSAPKKSPSG
jgi:hypothetical protein